MEKNKKELKTLSYAILFLVALSLIRLIVDICVNGLPKVNVEGVSAEVANVMTIVAVVLSFVLLLPQVYVGVKGVKIANGGKGDKWHIVIAVILGICALTAVVSNCISMVKTFNFDTVLAVVDSALDVAIFVWYIITARKIAKG
jgi:hypothetical protein